VSLHWHWVCERLDDEQVGTLAERTERQLRLTNEWLASRSARSAPDVCGWAVPSSRG
jgi:hypothetical protein